MDKIEIKDILTKYPIVLSQEHFDKLVQDLKSLMDSKWISVLKECATKIEEETYTENREEDNLVEHVVNEIRNFKPTKEDNMKKAKLVKVTLELRQGSDGHWLSFKNGTKEVVINIENCFPKRDGIINNTIRDWARAQFKD